MKAHWWSCVLGLLCMPAAVMLRTWTVSQDPLSISLKTVNSSAEITCSTSLSGLIFFNFRRRFHVKADVVFLSLDNGQVNNNVIAAEFKGRIHIVQDQQLREGYGFTLQLSLLRLEDTDLYYCDWKRFQSEKSNIETMSSNGTVIIVRERDPQEQCTYYLLDVIFVTLSVTASTVLLTLIGVLTVRYRRQFKKQLTPGRAVAPTRPNRPQHVCLQQRAQHCPYLSTSANTSDFRGIL